MISDIIAPLLGFILGLCIISVAMIMVVANKINELIETGLHDTLGMEISDDDIRKIVELVLDELDRRKKNGHD